MAAGIALVLAATGWAIWAFSSDDERAAPGRFATRTWSSIRWAAGGEPKNVSICDLVARGADHQGQKVRVRAIYETDGIEHSSLGDDACLNSIVQPDEAPDIVNNAAYQDWDRFGAGLDRPDALPRTQLTLTGRFHWKATDRPSGTIEIHEILSAQRVPADPRDAERVKQLQAAFELQLPKGFETRAYGSEALRFAIIRVARGGDDYVHISSSSGPDPARTRGGDRFIYDRGGRRAVLTHADGRRAGEYYLRHDGGWPSWIRVNVLAVEGDQATADRIGESVRLKDR